MDEQSKKDVLKVVYNIIRKWELTGSEMSAILGFQSPSDLTTFQETPNIVVFSSNLETRLSLILNIHAELRRIFNNPENVYGYMKMMNNAPPFFGMKPIELASRDVDSLNKVFEAFSTMKM